MMFDSASVIMCVGFSGSALNMPYLYAMFDTVLKNAMLNCPTNPVWLRIDGDYNYGGFNTESIGLASINNWVHFSARQLRGGDEALPGGDLHVREGPSHRCCVVRC